METNEKIINEPYGFIYITTNIVNGMRYLGQKRIEFGIDWHSYLGSGKYLKRAIKKYGKENFYRNIVCFCYSEDELNRAEYDLSLFLNVVEDSSWYNLCYGGGGKSGYKMSEEQVERLRQRTIEQMKNPEMRKHLSELAKERNNSDEFKKNQSEMMKSLWQDDDFRKKVIENKSVLQGENHPMYGYQWSEEQRQHMRDVMIEKNKDEQYKNMVRSSRVYASGQDNPLYGIPKSEEIKEKLREAMTGRYVKENNPFYGHKHTEESKQIMRDKALKRIEENGVPFKGQYHTEETREQMKKSSQKRWSRPEERERMRLQMKERMQKPEDNPRAKKIIRLYDLKIYECMIYASQDNDVHVSTMRKYCKQHNGFMYYDEWITKQNN
jgi:hypothetical protein